MKGALMPAVRGDCARRAVGSVAERSRAGGIQPALVAFVVSAAILLGASSPAHAGAWTLSEGTGQAIVTGLYSQADEAFDADGAPTPRPEFEKGAVAILVEYGLTETFTLLGEGEFGAEREGDLPFARPALSHVGIGGRLRLYEADGFVASGQISARVEDAHGAADAAVDTFGWDAPQIEARALAGYGFTLGDYPAFGDAQAVGRKLVHKGENLHIQAEILLRRRARGNKPGLGFELSTVDADDAGIRGQGGNFLFGMNLKQGFHPQLSRKVVEAFHARRVQNVGHQ